jgi:hypothetical protein
MELLMVQNEMDAQMKKARRKHCGVPRKQTAAGYFLDSVLFGAGAAASSFLGSVPGGGASLFSSTMS